MALVELITVNGFAESVGSVQELLQQSTSGTEQVLVQGWWAGSNSGGGVFYYDSNRNKSEHDGGTVISPTVPFGSAYADFLNGVGETEPTGKGCWVRAVDGDPYPEWFGAIGNNSFDCAPALQAALDYCSGKRRSSTQAGRMLRLHGGRYVFNTGLTYTWRLDNNITDDGDMRRLSIEGDAPGSTYLIYNGSQSTPALTIKGGQGGGIYIRAEFKNFRLWRSLGLTRYLGTGISMVGAAVYTFTNVDLGIFNTGLDARDTLYGTFRNCDFSGNNQGVYMSLTSRSSPNSILFDRCMFGGCKVRGAYIISGGSVEFRGCTFEGIGTDGTGQALLYQGGPHEAGMGLTVDSCYFENNFVQFDLEISNGTAYSGTHIIKGNSFNRPNLARAPSSGSVNLYSATATMRVLMQSNGFKGFNNYVANSSRPSYVVQSELVRVEDQGNFFMYDEERPRTNGFPVQGLDQSRVAAAARVNADGSLVAGFNVASVTKTGTGAYTVTFTRAIRANAIAVANPFNALAHACATVVGTGTVQVLTHSSANTVADTAFNVVVVGEIT